MSVGAVATMEKGHTLAVKFNKMLENSKMPESTRVFEMDTIGRGDEML